MEYTESYLEIADNLKLFYRDFPGSNPSAPVILCLHGVTRNGDDFLPMIQNLRDESNNLQCRFIVPDMRGRGLSDYDSNAENYILETYVEDCWRLLAAIGTEHCAIIGTSMGGLVAISMHDQYPERVSGILLNDIGPIIPRQGLAYILTYLGKFMSEDSWSSALSALKTRLNSEYPSLSEEAWKQMAQRTYSENEDGSWIQRYDKNIRLPVLKAYEQDEELDLWQAYANINKPILLLRGILSQLLPLELAQVMLEKNKQCELAEISDRGHVPILDEPEVITHIQAWLKKLV